MLTIILCSVEHLIDSVFLMVLPLTFSSPQTDAVPFKWATLYNPNELFPVKNHVDVNLRWQERHQSQLGVTGMF